MSGDPFPLNLPLPRFATDSCEATDLYRELRKPLLRYLAGLGLSTDEAQDVVQDAFLSLHKHLAQRRLLSETEDSGPSKEPTQAKTAWVGHPENIRGWMFRVAHNRARNFQQSYAQRLGEPLDPVFDAASRESSPEQAVLAKEKFQPAGQGHSLVGLTGAGVPHVTGGRIALSRNRRSARGSNFHGSGHGRASGQEASGEMPCVTFQETWLRGWTANSPETKPPESSGTSRLARNAVGASPTTKKRAADSPPHYDATLAEGGGNKNESTKTVANFRFGCPPSRRWPQRLRCFC